MKIDELLYILWAIETIIAFIGSIVALYRWMTKPIRDFKAHQEWNQLRLERQLKVLESIDRDEMRGSRTAEYLSLGEPVSIGRKVVFAPEDNIIMYF
jgi:hypothetical protein